MHFRRALSQEKKCRFVQKCSLVLELVFFSSSPNIPLPQKTNDGVGTPSEGKERILGFFFLLHQSAIRLLKRRRYPSTSLQMPSAASLRFRFASLAKHTVLEESFRNTPTTACYNHPSSLDILLKQCSRQTLPRSGYIVLSMSVTPQISGDQASTVPTSIFHFSPPYIPVVANRANAVKENFVKSCVGIICSSLYAQILSACQYENATAVEDYSYWSF